MSFLFGVIAASYDTTTPPTPPPPPPPPTCTETSSTTETESQACGTTTTWYCRTNTGSTFTSSSDQTGGEPCVSWTVCSTTSYPSTPQVPC